MMRLLSRGNKNADKCSVPEAPRIQMNALFFNFFELDVAKGGFMLQKESWRHLVRFNSRKSQTCALEMRSIRAKVMSFIKSASPLPSKSYSQNDNC
ncbi:hypothetical protein VNO77_09476 [Canavalia gladiata]|uniref:Uncharacterized protein n=1 Tax=Canavalia gladiata TaxID=3824 RepID=A0AAN9M9X8_CANGL